MTGPGAVAVALVGTILGAACLLFLIYREFARHRDSW